MRRGHVIKSPKYLSEYDVGKNHQQKTHLVVLRSFVEGSLTIPENGMQKRKHTMNFKNKPFSLDIGMFPFR